MTASHPSVALGGGVHLLGGTLPLDGRLSWAPETPDRHVAVACYLIEDGPAAYLIDSGAPIHCDLILGQLEPLVGGIQHLTVLLTRPVEYDSQGNVVALMARLPIREVRNGGIPPHFLNAPLGMEPAFQSTEDDPDGVAPGVTWQTVIKEHPVHLEDGSTRRELMVLDPKLRMLTTNWYFDHASKTLFTGDMFGHAYASTSGELRVLTEHDDDTTTADVRRHLMAKHSWLAAANTSEIVADLDKQVKRCGTIHRIAPSNGGVLEGEGVVQRHLGLMRQLLIEISQTEEM